MSEAIVAEIIKALTALVMKVMDYRFRTHNAKAHEKEKPP
jgi:hypothetical protein